MPREFRDVPTHFPNGLTAGGSPVLTEAYSTLFGLSLLDDPDAATARATLGLGTAAVKNTGTSGDAVPLLNAGNAWSSAQTFNAGANFGTAALATTLSIIIQGAAGTTKQMLWRSGASNRIGVSISGAETGSNVGADYLIFAYNDDATAAGTLLRGARGSRPSGLSSGVTGKGNPWFSSLAPAHFNLSRANSPNAPTGNYYQHTDVQPEYTLGNNPISTTNDSPDVVINIAGHSLTTSCDVNIGGATAVGGLTLSGWYRITATTTNTITVNAGSNATSSASGGGSAVTLRPSHANAGDRLDFTPTTSGDNYPVARVTYLIAEPEYYRTLAQGGGPSYQGMFTHVVSPSDDSGANSWNVTGMELDVVNRGTDPGYRRDIFTHVRPVKGFLSACENSYAAYGGNEGKNAHCAYLASRNVAPNSTNRYVKWYQGYVVAPGALVSDDAGVGGVGGIGVDIMGGYLTLGTNPIATTNGSSTVTVNCPASTKLITGHATPTNVYIPAAITVNGVTFAAGSYAMSNVTETTFRITGSGSASSTGSGGGTGLWVAFDKDAPRAPFQVAGWFSRGLEMVDAIITSLRAMRMRNGHFLSWRNAADSADIDALTVNSSNHLVFGAPVRLPTYTVAGLPTGAAGLRAFVTDANATTFASVVAGGGSNGVPVYHDGTNWRIG